MDNITSVLSFPDRGPWGSSSYRGNCSGHVYKALFEQLRPQSFCDPMMGSGTSIEVAREMGIEAYGFDLRLGFNALRDSIVAAIGKQVSLTISHPPYGSMIAYSGSVWGSTAHPDDLSHCESDEDFHAKLQRVLLNQRDATLPGGYYGTIIGDLRQKGRYVSYQAEVIARMPTSELAGVLIKAQHNCVSDRRTYARMALPRVMHEYVILFRRAESSSLFAVLKDVARAAHARLQNTWKSIVHHALVTIGGKGTLAQIYQVVSKHAGDRTSRNTNWQAKVRQCLQLSQDLFVSSERGVWGLKGS